MSCIVLVAPIVGRPLKCDDSGQGTTLDGGRPLPESLNLKIHIYRAINVPVGSRLQSRTDESGDTMR